MPSTHFKQIKRLLFFSFLLIAQFGTIVNSHAASETGNREDEEALIKSIDYAFHENYDQAKNIIIKYINKHPDRPEGYFFMSAVYFEYMNAFRDESKTVLFNKYASICTKKAKNLIRINKDEAAGYFYLGAIAGYQGLVRAREQKLISAFRAAIITKRNLEIALKLDPKLYDSYFGLGTLYYFASKKHIEEGGLVGWIIKKFITKNRDMREDGIKMIKKAINHGRMTSQFAYSTLMWIMMSEKDYITAFDMAKVVKKNYPEDMHGYWVVARIEIINGNCEEATKNLNMIIEMIENNNLPLSKFEDIQTGLLLAKTCTNINKWDVHKITNAIRTIRRRLVNYEKIIIEYQNARQVAKDWKKMLHDLELKSRRIRGL